jgi:hypothetical protein
MANDPTISSLIHSGHLAKLTYGIFTDNEYGDLVSTAPVSSVDVLHVPRSLKFDQVPTWSALFHDVSMADMGFMQRGPSTANVDPNTPEEVVVVYSADGSHQLETLFYPTS